MSWWLWQAMAIWCRLLPHWVRAAASRTFWTAGTSKPIRMAIIAIKTSNSISVKPLRWVRGRTTGHTSRKERKGRNQVVCSRGGSMAGGKGSLRQFVAGHERHLGGKLQDVAPPPLAVLLVGQH